MALALGEKLGPFEILAPLGAGGMGEVYRAWDTRLERTVAIKVLPERVSQKPEKRNQLENEARAISKLSHPNICTLHDISHHQGRDFLVLELVEGKTLREVLTAGSIPVRKIIPLAVQIADGLARAHELGIVHRDLKPENLMVSGETVKILDFGLARLGLESEEALTGDHTAALQTQTEPGTILGTLGYMSPEQAKGGATDFRSDQFSFGVVLYEMLTGRRPFRRASAAETLGATIHDHPESIGRLNPEVPPPLSWVVERCLAKEADKRYFSTLDLVLVPGLAFDARGGRLGRGAGFYDRFLAALPPRAVACGAGFQFQVVGLVPTEAHDVRLGALLTETQFVTPAVPL